MCLKIFATGGAQTAAKGRPHLGHIDFLMSPRPGSGRGLLFSLACHRSACARAELVEVQSPGGHSETCA